MRRTLEDMETSTAGEVWRHADTAIRDIRRTLRRKRRVMELTQAQVASRLDFTHASVNGLESGASNERSWALLCAWARVLGYEVKLVEIVEGAK